MDVYSEINRKLREMGREPVTATPLFTAEVKSVEGETCTVAIGEAVIDEVMLTPADEGADGKLVITPKTGSMVTVADLSGGTMRRLAVVHWGEVEKVTLSAQSVELNGGDNGGLVKIEKLTERLNKIEQDINKLKTVFFTTWTVTPQDGGAALKAAASAWAGDSLQETQVSDMEDAKVKH